MFLGIEVWLVFLYLGIVSVYDFIYCEFKISGWLFFYGFRVVIVYRLVEKIL